MAIIVTATLDPGAGAYVHLTAAGGVPPYTWTAHTVTTSWELRGSAGDGSSVFDGAAPLGTTVTYSVRDAPGTTADTIAVVLPDDVPAILSDALDPTRYVVATVVDQLPNTWDARSVWFDVIDRADPFVALAPMRLRSGQLVIRREGTDERQTLLGLLRPGTPLRLRGAVHGAIDDVILLPGRVAEALVMPDDKAGPRLFTIDYQAVTAELGPYVADPSWTWALLTADPRTPTWADVVDDYATWADVLTGTRAP